MGAKEKMRSYDMGCDCGKRKVSYNEKRDYDSYEESYEESYEDSYEESYEESAKLEDHDQDQVLKFKE